MGEIDFLHFSWKCHQIVHPTLSFFCEENSFDITTIDCLAWVGAYDKTFDLRVIGCERMFCLRKMLDC